MPDQQTAKSAEPGLLGVPLFRLLAINLAAGAGVTLLLVGGLLVLNPGGLRELIFADRSPAVPLIVLLGSFFVTFGSAAMGSAIMMAGHGEHHAKPRGPTKLAAFKPSRSRSKRTIGS
jgi:hypothetical protein